MNFSFSPYEGQKEYIFISYAHKNADEISPLVEKLSEYGYLLWYDRGIEYGDRWINSIEQHVRKASVILSFISPEYADSDWCMREYTYAEKIGKKVIHIKIGTGEIVGALSMMISNRQIINDSGVLDKSEIISEAEKALDTCGIYPNFNEKKSQENSEKPVVENIEKKPLKKVTYTTNSKPQKINKMTGIIIASVVAVLIFGTISFLLLNTDVKDTDNTKESVSVSSVSEDSDKEATISTYVKKITKKTRTVYSDEKTENVETEPETEIETDPESEVTETETTESESVNDNAENIEEGNIND